MKISPLSNPIRCILLPQPLSPSVNWHTKGLYTLLYPCMLFSTSSYIPKLSVRQVSLFRNLTVSKMTVFIGKFIPYASVVVAKIILILLFLTSSSIVSLTILDRLNYDSKYQISSIQLKNHLLRFPILQFLLLVESLHLHSYPATYSWFQKALYIQSQFQRCTLPPQY